MILEDQYPYQAHTEIAWQICLGMTFSFFILSFFIGVKSKEKSFQYYTFYLGMILLYLVAKEPFNLSFSKVILNKHLSSLRFTQVIAYYANIHFMIYFMDVHVLKKKLFHRSRIILNLILISCFLVYIYSLVFNEAIVFERFYHTFFYTISLFFTSYVLYQFILLPGKLKNFVLIGSFIYFFTCIISAFQTFVILYDGPEIIPSSFIYYLGLIIEICFFSLGLAYKIQFIYIKQIGSEKELTSVKQKQNILLQEKIKSKEKELKILFEKNEKEKVNAIALQYESELNKLKISVLRNQMNPHFIFNSLNSIKLYIINSEKEQAIYYLNKFSKLIRSILSSSNNQVSNLQQEIDFLSLYIEIENIRFEDQLTFSILIDQEIDLEKIKIPSLILQPLIENAIWHGLSSKKGTKKITLSVSLANHNSNFIQIKIIDNGIGRKKSSLLKKGKLVKNQSIGLDLTLERFEIFSQNYTNKANLTLIDLYENNSASGTKVAINIPLV